MNFFTQSEPSESLLKRAYITTYRDDFGTPHSNQQQAGPTKRKPLLHHFPEKRDIPLHPFKEKMTSPCPVRDTAGASPCPVQRKGVPPRPIQMKKVPPLMKEQVTSPHPVTKAAPSCPGQKVALPNPSQKVVPPVEEERVTPSHPVRKTALARPLQKVAPPQHPQETMVPPPCPVRKVTPCYTSMDNVAVEMQHCLENEAAQIQYNLHEKAAQIHLNMEEKAAQIHLNMEEKAAQIQHSMEEKAAQIHLNMEEKALQIHLNMEEKAAQIQLIMEKKEAEIQCNLEKIAAQIQLNLEDIVAQIQSNLEEMVAQIQFNLQQISAQIQFDLLGQLGLEVLIQPYPEEMTAQRVEETASRIQHDFVLNGTLLHHELTEREEEVSSGTSLESFLFHKVVGKGAFGKVMLAELKDSGELFAIKALKKECILANNHVECTKVEKRVLALATGNPFLTHLHSTFQTKDSLFFVMEYVNGRDLYFHIVVMGHFDLHSTQFYVAEIICGLQFLHKNGVIYRDLKLNNVMLDADGHIKIVDFGLCKDNMIDGKAMSFCGTEHYIAPEIFQGKPYSFPVDWWSLGVLVFEMLTGDSPFQGDNEDELSTSVCTDPLEYPNSLDQDPKDLLQKLLERDPNHRLGVAGDIRAHPFFDVIDWPTLEKREMEPPFKPNITGDTEDDPLDLEFLSKMSCLSDRDTVSIDPEDQLAFAGFSFINPRWRG